MADEIEKKFLLYEDGSDYTTSDFLGLFSGIEELMEVVMRDGVEVIQGYLPLKTGQEIISSLELVLEFEPTEARLRKKGERYILTYKGKSPNGGLTRPEKNCEVDQRLFDEYWPSVTDSLRKIRLDTKGLGYDWEIDYFTDRNLIMGEAEVDTEDKADAVPHIGLDITKDPKYKNVNLAR